MSNPSLIRRCALGSSVKELPLSNAKSLCLQFSSISSAPSTESEHFIIQILLQYHQTSISTTTMIDSGATSNFIYAKFAKSNILTLFQRTKLAVVQTVDSSAISSGMVMHESRLKLAANDHLETISTDAAFGHSP